MVHIKKGELAPEEKALLEVIGKGTGAGLRRKRCPPGPQAWRSAGPADPGLRGCEDRESASLPLMLAGCGSGELGRDPHGWDRSGGCRGPNPASALGKAHMPGPQLRYSEPPRGVGSRAFILPLSYRGWDRRPSGRPWPGGRRFSGWSPKGRFDFRRPKGLDSWAVPAPAGGAGRS